VIKTFFIYISGLCSSVFFLKSEVKEFASEINNFNNSSNKTNAMLEKLIKQQNKTLINIDILDKKSDLSFGNLRLGQQNIERISSSNSNNVAGTGLSFSSLLFCACGLVGTGVVFGFCLHSGLFSGLDSSVGECFKELKQTQGQDIKKIADYLVDFKLETKNDFLSIKTGSNQFFKEFATLKNDIESQKFEIHLQNLKNNNNSSVECIRHETLRR
jgi:hypothetical protein